MRDSEANNSVAAGDDADDIVMADGEIENSADNNHDGSDVDFGSDLSILLALAAGGRHLSYPSIQMGGNGSAQEGAASHDDGGISTTQQLSSRNGPRGANVNANDAADPSPNTKSDPPSNEDLVDNFLQLHKTWATYNKILSHLCSWRMGPSQPVVTEVVQSSLDFARECLAREENGSSMQTENTNTNEDDDETKMQQSREEDATTPTHSAISLEELSKVLTKPGMRFRGRIFIPGMSMDSHNASSQRGWRDSENSEMNDTNSDDGGDDQAAVGGRSNTSSSLGNEGLSTSENVTLSEMGGAQQANGDTYELVVIEQGKDVFGNSYILATHQAYGDEQAVHIEMNIRCSDNTSNQKKNDGCDDVVRWLEVDYADGETVCTGRWNPQKFCLEGHVKQRLQVNDGIFHSDAVTHVFTLYPCTNCFPMGREHINEATCASRLERIFEKDNIPCSLLPSYFEKDILSTDTRALAAHRDRTHRVLVESLQSYNKLLKHLKLTRIDISIIDRYYKADLESEGLDELLNEKQRNFLKLRNAHFADMFVEACIRGEVLCAEFRRRASLLDGLSFETFEDRNKHINEWKTLKMDLASAHGEWDGYAELLHSVCTGAFLFASSPIEQLRVFSMRRRLAVSFECFERAYQSTCVRLPMSYLQQFSIDNPREELGDCIICQSPLIEEGVDDANEECSSRVYQLPCSHCFHEQCVHQWLHDNSSCPVCRFDLRRKQTS